MSILITDGTKSTPLSSLPAAAWTPSDDLDAPGTDRMSDRQSYSLVPYLYRAVDIRAKALSGLPYRLEKRGKDITEHDEYKELRDRLRLMLYLAEASLTLRGAAYWELATNQAGKNLTPFFLTPWSVAPQIDPIHGLQWFNRAGGNVSQLAIEQVLYIWQPDPTVEIGPGRGPVATVLAAAGVLHALDIYAQSFFSRGGIKMTLISVPPTTAKQEKERLKDWWDRLVGGVRSSWRSIVVSSDVKPTVIGSDPKDTSAPELTNISREDILAGLGVPQSLIRSDALAGGTVDAERLNFYDFTVLPQAWIVQPALNEQYLDRLGIRLTFDPDQLEVYQAAELKKAQGLIQVTGEPFMLPDEARERLGLEPKAIAQARRRKQILDQAAEEEIELDPADLDASGQPVEDDGSEGAPAEQVDPETMPPAELPEEGEPVDDQVDDQVDQDATKALDLQRWQRKALKALHAGRPLDRLQFRPDALDQVDAAWVRYELAGATDEHSVKAAIDSIKAAPGAGLDPRERALYERLRAVLQRYGDDVVRQIMAGGEPSLDGLDQQLRAALVADLTAAALESMEAFAAVAGPLYDTAEAGGKAAAWAREYTYDLVRRLTDSSRTVLQNTVKLFFETAGMRSADVAALLSPAFGPRRAEVIAVTETTRAAAQAAELYRQHLVEHGLDFVLVWDTSNDDRTCAICGPRHGAEQGDDWQELPPAHPRCRCRVNMRQARRPRPPATKARRDDQVDDDRVDPDEVELAALDEYLDQVEHDLDHALDLQVDDEPAAKHMPGGHDQRSHGRATGRRTAARAAYSTARAGGASVDQARAAAKDASTYMANHQRMVNIEKQMSGHTTRRHNESLNAEFMRLADQNAQISARLDPATRDEVHARSEQLSATVRGRQKPTPKPSTAPDVRQFEHSAEARAALETLRNRSQVGEQLADKLRAKRDDLYKKRWEALERREQLLKDYHRMDLSGDALDAMHGEIEKLSKQANKLKDQSDDLLDRIIRPEQLAIESVLHAKGGRLPELRFDDTVTPADRRRITAAIRDANKLTNTTGLENKRILIGQGKGVRAHAINFGDEHPASGQIVLDHSDRSPTIVHEYGHHIEYRNPAVRQRAIDYLNARTHGETPQKLRDLTGDSNYNDDEVATPDKFKNPYTGKRYGRDSTEIISMGMQYLHDDPVQFAHDDPDYFMFMYDTLRGAQ